MQIRKIEITNFGGISQKTVELTPGQRVVLLTGKNGSGKSTIIGALKFALFGQLPFSCSNMGEFVRTGPDGKAQKARIFVEFDINGQQCSLTVSLSCDADTGKTIRKQSLTVNEKTHTAAATVSQQLSDLGLSPDVCSKVIVEQRQLHAWLYEQPAKRLDELQKLFGLSEAEAVRSRCQSLSELVEAPDLSRELGDAQAAIDEVALQLASLRTDMADQQLILSGIDMAAIEKFFADADRAYAQVAQRKILSESLDKAELTRVTSEGKVTAARQQVDSLKSQLSVQEPTAAAAQARLQSIQDALQSINQRKAVQDKLTASLSVKPVAPERQPSPDTLPQTRQELTNLLAARERISQRLADLRSHKLGHCDVCGAECPICKAGATHDVKPEDVEREIAAIDADIQPRQKFISDWDSYNAMAEKAQQSFAVQLASWESYVASLQEQLAAIPDVPQPDLAEMVPLKQQVADAEQTRTLLIQKTAELSACQTALSQAAGQIQDLQSRLADLGDLLPAPTPEDVKRVSASRDLFMTTSGRLSQSQTAEKQLMRLLEQRSAAKADLDTRQASNSILRRFKAELDVVISAFHRTRLPARALLWHLQEVARMANETLFRLGADFSICFKEGDFWAKKADGTDIRATLLSGGQAARWCVAFLLCIHKLYVHDAGLIVMDEPTDGLDVDGQLAFAKLLDDLGDLLGSTQLVVATHFEELVARADCVVNLSA